MAKDPYKYFRVEARELADQLGQGLIELERNGSGGEVVPRLLRLAHTLKGAARVVRQPEIADLAHDIEDALGPLRDLADIVPRENIDSVLRLVDAIAERVVALGSGADASDDSTAAGSAANSAAKAAEPRGVAPRTVVEESPRATRADVNEIDELLEGVAEVHSQIAALQRAGTLASRARRLADGLAELAAIRPGGSDENRGADVDELRAIITMLDREVEGTWERANRELQQVRDTAEQLRLVPAGDLFPSLDRAVRDSAQILSKRAAFVATGGDVRLDAHVVRSLQDALIQMVRNAVAHGIETRPERARAGKPEEGRVTLEVVRRGRRVIFRCSDDGAGIDTDALREAAIRRGSAPAEVARLDTQGLVALMLKGGMSTARDVTAAAGRGIGMDIVRDIVAGLGGEIVVRTQRGLGTTVELVVPFSLSSVQALIVDGGGVSATIPLSAIRHTVRLSPSEIQRTSRGETVIHDDRATPLVSLSRLLTGAMPRRGRAISAIVVEGSNGAAAIAVERMLGTANIVVRSLPEFAPADAIVAGASLAADGSPLLMLDADGLVAAALAEHGGTPQGDKARRPLLVIDDSLTTRMLEQSILESAGYEVDVATSAEEGLERARARDYALFLVDVEMPGMDGFGFIETIRRDPALRDRPAILVTSLSAPEHKRRGEQVGAQGFVVKSEFDQHDLLRRIEKLTS